VRGYEIHHGETAIPTPAPLDLAGKPDGMVSSDGQILGSYLHGLFDEPAALNLILDWAGATSRATQSTAETLETAIDRLTDALEAALDFEKALAAGLPLEAPCAR
jgi:adenosylcobyric acid synthase